MAKVFVIIVNIGDFKIENIFIENIISIKNYSYIYNKKYICNKL